MDFLATKKEQKLMTSKYRIIRNLHDAEEVDDILAWAACHGFKVEKLVRRGGRALPQFKELCGPMLERDHVRYEDWGFVARMD
jgi:hypothetical protein